MKPIIYVSKKCPPCKRLLLLLQKRIDLKGDYQLICIDESPFPKYIKKVPCMVIDNNIIDSDELFNLIIGDEKNNGNQNQNQNQNLSSDECIGGYCNISMDFSSLDGSDINDNKFTYLDDNQNNQNIIVHNSDNSNNSKNSNQFDKDYEKFMQERGKIH